jgi:hypothetical protein
VDDHRIYALVGEAGFRRLVAAFYRQVPGDPILGPMYPPHDLADAERRLCDFLIGRFGGPQYAWPNGVTLDCECATCRSPLVQRLATLGVADDPCRRQKPTCRPTRQRCCGRFSKRSHDALNRGA